MCMCLVRGVSWVRGMGFNNLVGIWGVCLCLGCGTTSHYVNRNN